MKQASEKLSRPLNPLLSKWGGDACGSEQSFSGLTLDSRKIESGDIFFCVAGERFDGNDFIEDARKSGAALIVSERAKPEGFEHPYQRVDDVRDAMADAATYFYGNPSEKTRILGVTGTNGKTSTTHLIEHILNSRGSRCGLVGTMGARWPGETSETDTEGKKSYVDLNHTTPQCIDLQMALAQMVDARISHIAMEVSSHALALKRVHQCHFASATLTNVSQDHLDFHKSMENYWRAKLMLFTALSQSSHSRKFAILNRDDALFDQFKTVAVGCAEVVSYGMAAGKSDFSVEEAFYGVDRTSLKLLTPEGRQEVDLALLGHFNVYNALAALAVCFSEGVTMSDCLSGLGTFTGVEGRFQVVAYQGAGREPLVIVDYAHSPDGLENVLSVARNLVPEGGRLVAVFGCGGDRDKSKRPQMGEITESLADVIIVTSDNPRTEDPKQIIGDILAGISRMQGITVEQDRARAIQTAINQAADEDVVVVAGKGHETYQLVGNQVLDFDDREEVRKALVNRAESRN